MLLCGDEASCGSKPVSGASEKDEAKTNSNDIAFVGDDADKQNESET